MAKVSEQYEKAGVVHGADCEVCATEGHIATKPSHNITAPVIISIIAVLLLPIPLAILILELWLAFAIYKLARWGFR